MITQSRQRKRETRWVHARVLNAAVNALVFVRSYTSRIPLVRDSAKAVCINSSTAALRVTSANSSRAVLRQVIRYDWRENLARRSGSVIEGQAERGVRALSLPTIFHGVTSRVGKPLDA